MNKKIVSFVTAAGLLMTQAVSTSGIYAEGTKDMAGDSGSRPYTEWYQDGALQNMTTLHVYLNAGETVYLGTSVSNAKLYNENNGTASDWLFSNAAMGASYSDQQLLYVNTADIYLAEGSYSSVAEAISAGKTPGKEGVTLIDLSSDSDNTTPGYIYDRTQEKGGADLRGNGTGYKVSSANTISSDTEGYTAGTKTNANVFTAANTGIYTVAFFSSNSSSQDPFLETVDDSTPFEETQGTGTIASWDISVYNNGALQTGRVFTNLLNLNAGGNSFDENGISTGSLNTKIYAVTNDGYQYQLDLNGLDASELSLYANQLGLLTQNGTDTSSLMHSVRGNTNTLTDLSDHNINLNRNNNYNLFFETPSQEVLTCLGINTEVKEASNDGISDFTFTGDSNTTANQGYAGHGGTFTFKSQNTTASTYEITLDFTSINGGTVVLSNALNSTNSIYWDGKDANGSYVPAGDYSSHVSLKLISGEVHFPLLDAEQNPNGIKITRQNGSASDKTTVYYKNPHPMQEIRHILGLLTTGSQEMEKMPQQV